MITFINYLLELKEKPVPNWLRGIYFAVTIVMNLIVSSGITVVVLLVIFAGLAYQMSVASKNGKQYRFLYIS